MLLSDVVGGPIIPAWPIHWLLPTILCDQQILLFADSLITVMNRYFQGNRALYLSRQSDNNAISPNTITVSIANDIIHMGHRYGLESVK